MKKEILKLIEKHIINLETDDQKKNFTEIINYIRKFDFIPSERDLNNILISEKKKIFDLKVSNELDKSFLWLDKIYYNEISQVETILSNDYLIKKINGAKILLYGKTGTGKTQLVKKIISKFQNFKFIDKNFTSMLSPKMGQTQINLLNLAREINEIEGKKILFIDEIDSIISNRLNSDLGEHSRIIATFLQFLDIIDENVVVFAATNIKDNLDEAVLRRFNIKIEAVYCDLKQSMEILKSEGLEISTKRMSSIKKIINKKEYSFSELKNIVDSSYVSKTLNKNSKDWEIFIEQMKEFIFPNLVLDNLSRAEIAIVKKVRK